MRIAHMIDSLEVGGAQKLEVTFAAALASRGLDLTIISLHGDPDTLIPEDLRALGAKVMSFPARRLLDPGRIQRLVGFLKEEHFEILHTHLTFANILGVMTGRLAGIPVVSTLHTTGQDPRYYHWYRKRLDDVALRRGARHVIAVGDVVARAHEDRLRGQHVSTIVNAVAPMSPLTEAERNTVRDELSGDRSRPLLLSVGRLALPKGYTDLIAAMADVRTTHPTAALAIAGGGSLQPQMEAQIAQLGLEGHVNLLGSRDDIPRLLGAADLFVSSSHWEGLPVSVLEAMAAGLPIVATQVGDIPAVVVEGAGTLVPPHQPSSLADAIRGYLDDPTWMRESGQTGRTHVLQNYSPDVWADEILALYESLVAHPKPLTEQREALR